MRLDAPAADPAATADGDPGVRPRRAGSPAAVRRRSPNAAIRPSAAGAHRFVRARPAAGARRRASSTSRRRGARQAELAGGAYEDFLRRRLELILAERPSPVGCSRRREGLGTLRPLLWRPPPPKSRLIKRRRALRRPRRRGAAEPDRDRGAEVRHQRPPLLPQPPPGGLDVEAEGAQLLHRGAQLAARHRLVQAPLRLPTRASAARPRRTTPPSPSTRACPSACTRWSPTRS